VPSDLDAKDFKLRFLFGTMSDEERESVESRFMSDPGYFDSLCALEAEAMLDHTQGRLPAAWRAGFDARVMQSPARRRHVDQLAALAPLVAGAGAAPAHAGTATQTPWWRVPRFGILAACGAAVVLLVVVGQMRRQRAGAPPETGAVQGGASVGPVATLVLEPGLTRAELRQANIFRIPSGTQDVSLELRVPPPPDPVPRLSASLRPVGQPALAVSSAPGEQRSADALRVTLRVPATLLPRGDYVLTVSRETPAHTFEPFVSRFFTIDE
jgi:hypothetical protein